NVASSYNFDNTNTQNLRISNRQTFLTDSSINSDQQSLSKTTNGNHRFNLKLEYNIDSLNSIIYTPSISIQNSTTYNDDSTMQMVQKGADAYML
uniref:hypothetical protein n=1 Tax=Salmonella sp. SAL4360 TaxID=3159881 RepID=UPI00397BFB47